MQTKTQEPSGSTLAPKQSSSAAGGSDSVPDSELQQSSANEAAFMKFVQLMEDRFSIRI